MSGFARSMAANQEAGKGVQMKIHDAKLTAAEIATLVAIAPLDRWDLAWDDDRAKWVTAVTCPSCGERLVFEVSALDDFYCTVCDFDNFDESGRRTIPASL